MTYRAIYENGVFRPTEPVDLPEHTEVMLEASTLECDKSPDYSLVWNCLADPVETGIEDLADRHNEHQP